MSLKTSKYLSQLKVIAQEISVESSIRVQFEIIVKKVREIMEVDACSIYVLTGDDQLTLAAAEGLPRAAIGHTKISLQDGITGNIAVHQTLINAPNAQSHPDYLKVNATYIDSLSSYLGVPFIRMGKTIGVLSVMSSKRRKFSKVDEAFVSTTATHLSYLLNSSSDYNFSNLTCDLYKGVSGSPGSGIGRAYILMSSDLLSVADRTVNAAEIPNELQIWQDALTRTIDELKEEERSLGSFESVDLSQIIEAYAMIINSREFQREVEANIQNGMWAQGALKSVIYKIANKFLSLDDPYMRGRGEDFVNIGNKIYAHILQQEQPLVKDFKEPIVLVAPLISVLQLAKFDPKWISGIVCIGGSSLSHTAIIAKSLGIPAVMGVAEAIDIAPNDQLIIDGKLAEVHVNPNAEVLEYYSKSITKQKSLNQQLLAFKDQAAVTKNGLRVPVLANLGFEGDVEMSLSMGADGVGLFRSEFPFIARNDFPSESVQTQIYKNVLDNYNSKQVVMRTLDIGGDKALSYMPFTEENPFLGWRGIRFTLDNSAIFLTQIRSLLRASVGNDNLSILLPMVSDISEIISFHELLETAIKQLSESGITVKRPLIGIMIEVPSIIELMDCYHHLIDFVSIGSNDLTQYLLAIDRGNTRVAHLYDSLHPAVLKVIKRVIDSAKPHRIKVGICGEMASDPMAIPLLVAMGVDTLSMSPRNIPLAKWLIGELDSTTTDQLLTAALSMPTAPEVRSTMKAYLERIDAKGFLAR